MAPQPARPPTEPADKKTLTALAKVEERHDEEQIDVEFKDHRTIVALAPDAGLGSPPARRQNSRSGDSRRVCDSGHEHSPPSAGQPAHSARCGSG